MDFICLPFPLHHYKTFHCNIFIIPSEKTPKYRQIYLIFSIFCMKPFVSLFIFFFFCLFPGRSCFIIIIIFAYNLLYFLETFSYRTHSIIYQQNKSFSSLRCTKMSRNTLLDLEHLKNLEHLPIHALVCLLPLITVDKILH